MSDTLFYKVAAHDNNADDDKMSSTYAAWGNKHAVLFVLGEPKTDGFTASDPSRSPDDSTPRPATVLNIYKGVTNVEQLEKHLRDILNVDHLIELGGRPPIGDIDMSRFPGETFLIGELLT